MAAVAAQEHCQDLRNIFETNYLRHVPKRGIPRWRGCHRVRPIHGTAITPNSLIGTYGIHPSECNFINIDIQGIELMALMGASGVIPIIDAIIPEIDLIDMYENGALEAEIGPRRSWPGESACV